MKKTKNNFTDILLRVFVALVLSALVMSFAACTANKEIDDMEETFLSDENMTETPAETTEPAKNSAALNTATAAQKSADEKTKTPAQTPTQAPETTLQPTSAPGTETPIPTPWEKPGVPAKVIVIGGQSNAVGCTWYDRQPTTLKQAVGEEKYAEYAAGYDKIHITYLSELLDEKGVLYPRRNCEQEEVATAPFDKVFPKVKLGEGSWSEETFGPEIGIAEKLSAQYPDEDIFIVKVAKAGVNIPDYWRPRKYCYKILEKLLPAALERLEKEGYAPKVVSICWMQGETDATNTAWKDAYSKNLKSVADNIRAMCGKYVPEKGVPFIDAGITNQWQYHTDVNNAKKAFANSSPLNYYFKTSDLAVDTEHNNGAHYSPASVPVLGQRFGEMIITAINDLESGA